MQSREWAELVELVKAQNISRERNMMAKVHLTQEDALKHNYELGLIHGQRNVIALPLQIINIRKEEFHELVRQERHDDKRSTGTDREQYDPEQS